MRGHRRLGGGSVGRRCPRARARPRSAADGVDPRRRSRGRAGGGAVRDRGAGRAAGRGLCRGGGLDRPRLGRLPVHGPHRPLRRLGGPRLHGRRRPGARGPGGGQRGGRPVGRGAVPRTSQRAVLVVDPLRVGGGGGRGRPGPRRRAARARPGHRPLPATVRTVAGLHGAGLQAADRRRAGRPGRAGGAAGGPGRHRGARRDRGPPGPPGQLLLRAAPGDAGRAGGGVADRHAGLQAAAGLRLPPGARRPGAAGWRSTPPTWRR